MDASGPANQSWPPTRPCFPTFTVIGVIGLLILAAITLLRNRHNQPPAGQDGMVQPAAVSPSVAAVAHQD